MKKKIGLLIITLILTGCKINTIECNKKEIKNEIETNNSIATEIKNNQIINMIFSSEIIMPEKYINQKDILSSNIKEQYERIEQEYSIKPDITETETGTRIEFQMKEEQVKDFYNSKTTMTTKKEIIKEFTKQGYICEKK